MRRNSKICCWCLVLFSFICLVACSKETERQSHSIPARFHLLWTEDFSGLNSHSTIVSYDSKGNQLGQMNIPGALYYNIIPLDKEWLVDNGLQEVHVKEDHYTVTKHRELHGYFESGQYFYHHGKLVRLYNAGFDETGKYESKILLDQQESILSGFIYAFYPENDHLWLLVGDDGSSGSMRLVDYSLIQREILSTQVLDLRESDDYTALPIPSQHGFLITQHIPSKQGEDIREERSFLSVNEPIQRFSLKDQWSSKDTIDVTNIFDVNGVLYAFDESGVLWKGGLQFDKRILEMSATDIQLAKGGIIIEPADQRKGTKVWCLVKGEKNHLYHLDLKQLTIMEEVELENTQLPDHQLLYAFSVDD